MNRIFIVEHNGVFEKYFCTPSEAVVGRNHLLSAHIRDGETGKTGSLLFEINSRLIVRLQLGLMAYFFDKTKTIMVLKWSFYLQFDGLLCIDFF